MHIAMSTVPFSQKKRKGEVIMPSNDNGGIISFKMGHNDPVTGEFKRDLFWERMGAESGDPGAMIQMGFVSLMLTMCELPLAAV